MKAGVPTIATRYLRTIHDFVMLNPITDTPASRVVRGQAVHRLRNIFKIEIC
jgi:acetyl esterase